MNGRGVTVAGMIARLRTHTTKRGEPMAFAALEDLHGSVDLVIFPSVWKQVRGEVQVDQIVVVRGKVQSNSEQEGATILVDSVQTNVEVASAAEPHDDVPVDAESYDEELVEPWDSPRARLHDQRKAHVPPPPPNFEDWEYTESDSPEANNGRGNRVRESAQAEPHTVTVEVDPHVDWESTFRQAVTIAGRYRGQDAVALVLVGHELVMDFPDQATHFCEELRLALYELPGVVGVQVEA
jgi:hypothetical protein